MYFYYYPNFFLNRTGQNEVDIEIIFLFIKTKIIYNQIETSHTQTVLSF